MTLSWISVFLEAQAADFGAARNTQEAYGRDLKDFLAYLEARGAGFATATRAMVEDYLVHCDAAGLASATKARRLSSIKQLYRFAFEEELRKDNPAIQVKGPERVNLCRSLWIMMRSTVCCCRQGRCPKSAMTSCD